MHLSLLKELPLFAGLSDVDLRLLADHCTWAWYQPGERVVRQGRPAPDFFVVVEGQVEALLEGEDPTSLGLVGAGEFFGELAALTGAPAPYTVVARASTSVWRLRKEGLLLLLERNPDLNRQLILTLATRFRETGARLHRARQRERTLSDHIARQGALTHPEWIGEGGWSQRVRAAIVQGSQSQAPLIFVGEAGAGKELAAARVHYNGPRQSGPFIVLSGAEWSEQRWREMRRMAAHGTLLIKHAHLVPPEAVPLIQETLAGARRGRLPSATPRLLATAPAADDRDPSPVEEALLDEGFAVPIPPLRERREDIPSLVRHLLKKLGQMVGGDLSPITRAALRKLEAYPFLTGNVRELEWILQQAAVLAGDGPIDVDHLRLGAGAERAGRPKIGLALGGGVVRGTAHIGVLRALTEAGIPIDYLVGTSSGALIGALHAGGLDWQAMLTLLQATGWFSVAEPAWPRAGFLSNRPMRAFLERHLGARQLEELAVPFATVAADANTGQEVILRQGPLADAVRASTAIPGIFRPVELDGRLLVDGVVVNNVPASVARAMGADIVIAVDITAYGFTSGPPRSIPDAISRSFDIMARQTIAYSLEWADVVIRPHVGGLNGFSFASAPAFVSRGYQAAMDALPAISAQLSRWQQGIS